MENNQYMPNSLLPLPNFYDMNTDMYPNINMDAQAWKCILVLIWMPVWGCIRI